jgi:hypothetical protein
MTTMLTVSIWHNVTRDPQCRQAGIAEDAFAAFNDASSAPHNSAAGYRLPAGTRGGQQRPARSGSVAPRRRGACVSSR